MLKLIDPTGNLSEWEIWMVEANPVFDEKLKAKAEWLAPQCNGVYLYNQTAVYVSEGTVTFYLDTLNSKHNYWGSSLISSHPDVEKSGKKAITVQALDVSRLILENFIPEDFVIVKMDIEGYEGILVPDMERRGSLDLVDEVYCEIHNRFGIPGTDKVANILGKKLKKWW